jgi:LDH2 family malate/lactate/ureidoglycolate dehydrogenase
MLSKTRPRYNAEALRSFTAKTFEAYGVPADDAALGAEVLIDADLAGIESHGIAHLQWHPGYVPGLKDGRINPKPDVKVLRDSPVAATWDSDGGLGVVVGRQAMDACMEKAETSGIGMIAVTNGRHFGAAGHYARITADRDLIGMAMCNVLPIGVAGGGIQRVYGTNPIAMSAPVEGSHPFLLDIATTAVAGGKLEIAMRQGKDIPVGWAIDAEGNDVTDPGALRAGGGLLPLGSRMDTSSHKGYGLGLMVDIMTGVLSGMGSGFFQERGASSQAYWFQAWRIDAFRDVGEFKADMRRMVDSIRATTPEPGREEVLVAGDPEARAHADRAANGVPLDAETIEQLTELGEELGFAFPSAMG